MRTVLVIGMGEFGRHLAYRLLELKADVCIVDKSKELINILSEDFENAYVADCTQDIALRDLGIASFDTCVVSVGEDFQSSLEITSKLKEQGAKFIIAKASSDLQSKFLIMAGANEAVYPEKDVANKIAVKCVANNLLDVFEISDQYSVFEIRVLEEWVGKALKNSNIRLKYNLNVIAIKNGSKITIPDADYVFKATDTVFVFGKSSTAKKLSKEA